MGFKRRGDTDQRWESFCGDLFFGAMFAVIGLTLKLFSVL